MVSFLWEDETLFFETANRDTKPLSSPVSATPLWVSAERSVW